MSIISESEMSERPTPETDARTYVPSLGASTVPAEFARLLERERDEAREDLEFRRGLYKVQEEYLETARRERDKARELLKKALVRGDFALAETKKAKENLFWSDHQDKREIQRELAEAREQVQRLRVQLNHYTQANEMAEQAFSERNKAHKIAEQAIEDLAWFNETSAQLLRHKLEQLKEGAK
jgi:hypothetical protein